MDRRADSHKSENGKVAVIGGSLYQHGAPLFAALAAEAVGVDLLYISLPACHAEVAKAQSLNMQVHPFAGNDLTKKDVAPIIELLATMDCAVLGPGIARTQESVAAALDIVSEASCPLVIDATALQPDIITRVGEKPAVVTPHLGELERMEIGHDDIADSIKGTSVVVLLKGKTDRIVADGKEEEVAGGNAGLTVGGTGDALTGAVAGLIAQGMTPFDAAKSASMLIKRSASVLLPTHGYAFTTRDVIDRLPSVLHELA